MKLDNKKVIFTMAIILCILFIGSYAIMLTNNSETEKETILQIKIPELDETEDSYKSRLEAVDNLKEVRESNAPSIYDQELFDSLGNYNPELTDLEKKRIMDSVNALGAKRLQQINGKINTIQKPATKVIDTPIIKRTVQFVEDLITPEEYALDQELFFASNPLPSENPALNKSFKVIVDGTQTVKKDYRLRIRLLEEIEIDGKIIEKDTPLFGFVNFGSNRLFLQVESIDKTPIALSAYDLEDGSQGLYVVNSFRSDATQEVIDDVAGDINVAGVPQVGGILKIFRRNNRSVKATVPDNYLLLLKSKNKN